MASGRTDSRGARHHVLHGHARPGRAAAAPDALLGLAAARAAARDFGDFRRGQGPVVDAHVRDGALPIPPTAAEMAAAAADGDVRVLGVRDDALVPRIPIELLAVLVHGHVAAIDRDCDVAK